MANKTSNVSAAKPAIGGAVYIAPVSTALPTSANSELAEGFKALGYISDSGLTNDNSHSVTSIKAWGGDVVLELANEKPDSFQCTFIETLNVDVLKAVYGSDNVTGDLETGITVKATNNELVENAFVVDMVLREGVLKRIVIPAGVITGVSQISYADTAAIGYQTTISAHPDSTSNTHYEYITAKSNG